MSVNVAINLAALKATPSSDLATIYDEVIFSWVTGDFTGQADDVNVVKQNGTPLTTGAWVRQSAEAIRYGQRSVAQRLGETVSIKDAPYNAVGDGVADDAAAINAALAAGGTIRFPGPATYYCSTRLLVPVSGTRILIDPEVTVRIDGGTWNGVNQNPFLNCVHITADNCWVEGSGNSSIIENSGSDANGVGWLHCSGGGIRDVRLTGDKENVPAISDDTFQSGISIINSTAANPNGTPSNTVVENVFVDNWSQYGLNIYGTLAIGISVNGATIEDIGRAEDEASVGAGIVMTVGVSNILLNRINIKRCKGKGIFQSSAGANATGYTITNYQIENCGQDGISFTEECSQASVGGIGTTDVSIGVGQVRNCGAAGLKIGCYDNVGFQKNFTMPGLVATGNLYGVLVQTNDHPTNRVSNLSVVGAVLRDNMEADIAIGPNNDSVIHGFNNAGSVIDYQQSFTPSVIGGTSAGSTTYTNRSGVWKMIGDGLVWFALQVEYGPHTGTGDMIITGLPHLSAADAPSSVMHVAANNLVSDQPVTAFVALNSDRILLYKQVLASNTLTLGPLDLDTAGADVRITGVYRV